MARSLRSKPHGHFPKHAAAWTEGLDVPHAATAKKDFKYLLGKGTTERTGRRVKGVGKGAKLFETSAFGCAEHTRSTSNIGKPQQGFKEALQDVTESFGGTGGQTTTRMVMSHGHGGWAEGDQRRRARRRGR